MSATDESEFDSLHHIVVCTTAGMPDDFWDARDAALKAGVQSALRILRDQYPDFRVEMFIEGIQVNDS